MDIFANAKTVAAKPKGKKKADAPQIEVEGIEGLAALKAVSKDIEAAMAVEAGKVDTAAFNHFVSEGMKIKRKPVNVKGVENGSEGSLQLRVRSSRSVLSQDEQKLLEDNDIPFDEIVDKEDTFIINPAYVNDAEMMGKVAEALAAVNLPADYILKQEKESRHVATEKSIDAVFALEDEDDVRALLPLVITQASRVTLGEDADAFEIVEGIMADKEEAEAE